MTLPPNRPARGCLHGAAFVAVLWLAVIVMAVLLVRAAR